jgi:nucleoside-diphosphate-sugar epimerase
MKKAFLTGATGSLGSLLTIALLNEGYLLYLLARRTGAKSAEKRIDEVLSFIDPNYPKDRVVVLEGDVSLDKSGIATSDMESLKKANVKQILHIAADVSFHPVDLDGKIHLTNYTGTCNVMDIALSLGVSEFHYCGTAYAGTRRNPYEISKDDAEKEVVSVCQENGIRFSIYKPSTIVGDYKTGISQGFNGYLGASTVFHFVAQAMREGKSGAIVDLPFYFVCSKNSTMNIIPVDWVAETFIKLHRKGAKNEIYHLAHNNPHTARWAINEGFKNLGITGIKYIESPLSEEEKENYHEDRRMRRYQKRVDKVLEQFQPYCLSEKKFPLEATVSRLGDDFKLPPPIDPEFISRLFEYAMMMDYETPASLSLTAKDTEFDSKIKRRDDQHPQR